MLLTIPLVYLFQLVSTLDDECISSRSEPSKVLAATKTPYAFIAEDKRLEEIKLEGCEAKQIWLVSRHGTRYPSKTGLQLISQRLPELIEAVVSSGKAELCQEALEEMSAWIPDDLELSLEKKLHAEGELEMLNLAERYRARFPRLLKSDYHEKLFSFRSTGNERASQSQFHFAAGLFGRDVAYKVEYEPPVEPHDPVIRFYKVCARWQRDVKKNPDSLREQRLFEEKVIKGVIESVSKRLGLDGLLDLRDIDAMYNGCVFGQAWNPKEASPWCSVFTDEELSLLEYREDLEYYWQDGYGHDLNTRQPCVLAKDVVENFGNATDAERAPDEENGVFYFSHSGTILKFLSYLGLFRDSEDLRHDNYGGMRDRLWKTSRFDAFGSNVAFVLQKCEEEASFKVGLFVNERLTLMPGCEGLWCDFEVFRALHEERISECDLAEMCAVEKGEESILDEVADDRF